MYLGITRRARQTGARCEFFEKTTQDASAFFVVSHDGGYRTEPAHAPVSWDQIIPTATSNARM